MESKEDKSPMNKEMIKLNSEDIDKMNVETVRESKDGKGKIETDLSVIKPKKQGNKALKLDLFSKDDYISGANQNAYSMNRVAYERLIYSKKCSFYYSIFLVLSVSLIPISLLMEWISIRYVVFGFISIILAETLIKIYILVRF